MKTSVSRRPINQVAAAAAIGVSLFMARNIVGQATTAATAEVERVVVTGSPIILTGSNIPTTEEVGPNPVDTYRPADIEKLGIRNATDLTTFLTQEAGGTTNLNIGNSGGGTVPLYLRGCLIK